jgi:hypothetical protein
MKKLILSLTAPVVGLVVFFGLTSTVQAADVPNYNQLYQQSQKQAADQVDAKMAAHPTPSASDLRQQAQSKVTPTSSGAVSSNANTNTSGATTTLGANPGNIPADANVIVLNTGKNVKLNTSNDQSSTTSVTNNNDAAINQAINGNANTGNNTANRNISIGGNAGTIATGNAAVNSGEVASANSNSTAISGVCQDVVSNVTVYNTGNNLGQHSGTNNTCNTTVTNNNNATINQVANGVANTGNNTANRNIAIGGGTAGQITTGNANVGSLVSTDVNHNQVVIVGGTSNNGGPGSGANVYILNTADNADLSAYHNSRNATSITNNNSFNGDQTVNSSADTGHNTANGNINQNGSAGTINTGNATVNSSLSASANKNQTVIAGSGANATTNVNIVNTGNNLHSDTNTSVDNTTAVTNNNSATINQTVNATANTGYNQANRNIAFGGNAGQIVTGNAIVNTSLNANANQNETLISGAQGQATSNVNVLNTGKNAQVNATTDTQNMVAVTNNNQSAITQTVNTNANTGNNEANHNIGGGSITTGGVAVNSNVITNANGSYTFVIDSGTTGLNVFNQFLQLLMGQNLQDVLNQCHCSNISATGPASAGSNNTTITNTGNNATVLADHTSTRSVAVTNNNASNVNQTVNVDANTGNNTCQSNIGSCDIVTGDVVVNTTLLVDANWNFTIIGNVGNMPTPEVPQQPSDPQPQAGPSLNSPAVLAAVTTNRNVLAASASLPSTGAANFGLFGLALLAGGVLLRRQGKAATVKA